MTLFNHSGDEFVPMNYSGVDFETMRDREPDASEQQGLYYREQTFPGQQAAVDTALQSPEHYPGLSVDAYQAWAEAAWKKRHLTRDASGRFTSKLSEEVREVDNAVEEFLEGADGMHLVEEIGDYQWVVTALASNTQVVVSDAIKKRLYDYIAGTRVLQPDGAFGYPQWYDVAAALAVKRGSITLGELDNLIDEGFVPRFSPIMNLYEPEVIVATAIVFDLQMYSAGFRSLEELLYRDDDTYRTVLAIEPSETMDLAQRMVAESYLKLAALAHFAGSKISEAAIVNIRKINGRIQTGTIDKTDGDRSSKI